MTLPLAHLSVPAPRRWCYLRNDRNKSTKYAPGRKRWKPLFWVVAVAACALLSAKPAAGAMSPSECRNLSALLTHGPDYKKVKGEPKLLGADIIEFRLLTSPAPFESCRLVVYPFNDPTALECNMSVPLSAKGVMTNDASTVLRASVNKVAQDIAGCIGGELPLARAATPFHKQEVYLQRFVWFFSTKYHGPLPDHAIGVWLSLLLPKVGTDLTKPTSVEFEAQFHVMPKDEVVEWLQIQRRSADAQANSAADDAARVALQLVDAASSTKESKQQFFQRFGSPYRRLAATEFMAQEIVGDAWHTMSPSQQAEFAQFYEKIVMATLHGAFDAALPARFTHVDDGLYRSKAGRMKKRCDLLKMSDCIFYSAKTKANDMVVEYRLVETNKGWQVVDLLIAEISLQAMYETSIQEALEKGGTAHALDLLRTRVSRY